MNILINGLITGIAFGFFLQRGRVVRYETHMNVLLLKDMTIVKYMFSAIIVGMVGVHVLHNAGIVAPGILPTNIGANIIGGLTFGAGWAIMGYCPGTSVGAVGEGSMDALVGLLGMVVGAALFAEAYPALSTTVLTWGAKGSLTLPEVLGVNPWVVIIAFVLGGLSLFAWLEKIKL